MTLVVDSEHTKRIGLALSGGGFRATLYHLGIVRFLRDAGLLSSISHITAVSGGSILAAHLVQNWDRYTGTPDQFEAVASEIVAFARLDVRNRIVRRFPLALPIQALRWMAQIGSNHRLTRTGLLQVYYERYLYGDTCLFQLPPTPALHILSTNLTEGALCSFNRDGIIVQKRLPGELYRFDQLHAGLATLGLAVTASSAFPGFFPPLQINWQQVGGIEGQFNQQVFTDGGVFDNLGVRMFRNIERTWIGREAELTRRDFYDVQCVFHALAAIDDKQPSPAVVRLAQLYGEHGGSNDGGDAVIAGLRQVITRSQLYREPAFEAVQPEDPEAAALLRSVRSSGKDLEFHDRSWLNRQLLETVLRHATGKRCLRPLNAMFDAVLVSDAGKHLRAITQVQPMGMITTAMRASDIGMDRVWQLEKETFANQPGFVFMSIDHIVDQHEDATALHPEVQRGLQGIRTDMDEFSALEVSALLRHGYCVAREICRSRPELAVATLPLTPPWDPLEQSNLSSRAPTRTSVLRAQSKRGPTAEVIAARTLQHSALRQVWNRLFSWHDWTSYVYLALAAVLLMVGPVLLFRIVEGRAQATKVRKIVEAISSTDHDQQVVMWLAEQGTIAEWPARPAEEVAQLSSPSVSGLVYTTDRQIFDLRGAIPPGVVAQGKPPAPSIYIRRRIRLHKNPDYDPQEPFVLPFAVFAADCEVRCLNSSLKPKLSRLRQGADRRPETQWEVALDLSAVPIEEPVDIILEAICRDALPAYFEQDPHVMFDTRLPVQEMALWLLLPDNMAYHGYRVIETDPKQLEPAQRIIPSEGKQDAQGTILHWSLLSPVPGAKYECHWNRNQRDGQQSESE
jgi:predicted acylesterase/phospholipase RssA